MRQFAGAGNPRSVSISVVRAIEPYRFEQERQRLTTTLRQIADCIEALDVNELPEPMVRLAGPAEELVRVARQMLGRPFGE